MTLKRMESLLTAFYTLLVRLSAANMVRRPGTGPVTDMIQSHDERPRPQAGDSIRFRLETIQSGRCHLGYGGSGAHDGC